MKVLYVFCHEKNDYEWKFQFLSQLIHWIYDQIIYGLMSYTSSGKIYVREGNKAL